MNRPDIASAHLRLAARIILTFAAFMAGVASGLFYGRFSL